MASQVLGVAQTVAQFRAVAGLAVKAEDATVAAMAAEVARLAKEYAPVGETGNLRDGIYAYPVEHGVWGVTYARSTYYGRMQELGSVMNSAHPFLRPASDTAPSTPAEAVGADIFRRR